jgi:pimeloyl-ACP methyl ester carboxylesterase
MSDAGSRAAAAAAAPGLVLCATADDMTGTAQMRRRVADAAGADVVELDGLGHWWMVQDPTRSAAVLENYFAQQERR